MLYVGNTNVITKALKGFGLFWIIMSKWSFYNEIILSLWLSTDFSIWCLSCKDAQSAVLSSLKIPTKLLYLQRLFLRYGVSRFLSLSPFFMHFFFFFPEEGIKALGFLFLILLKKAKRIQSFSYHFLLIYKENIKIKLNRFVTWVMLRSEKTEEIKP